MSEELNDILREMRCGMIPKHRQDRELLLKYADRIEAAHKREIEDAIAATVKAAAKSASEVYEPHIQSERVGNAAKMREVVAETEKRIDKVISILTEIPDSCGYGGLLEDAADELCDLKEEFVKPALSAPARNCDLPEVAEGHPIDLAEKAWRVFRRSHKDSYLDAYGLLRCIGWLLAPATEKEGGAK